MRVSVHLMGGFLLWCLATWAHEAEEAEEALGEAGSYWLDGVHWVGLVGGALAVVALIVGLYIALALGGGQLARRARLRAAHMLCGGAAVGLAVVHAVGRKIQMGTAELELELPQLATLGCVLVGLSGLARRYPPGMLEGKHKLLAWLHRVLVGAALVAVVLHVLGEWAAFAGVE